jgi:hypothetical protein
MMRRLLISMYGIVLYFIVLYYSSVFTSSRTAKGGEGYSMLVMVVVVVGNS